MVNMPIRIKIIRRYPHTLLQCVPLVVRSVDTLFRIGKDSVAVFGISLCQILIGAKNINGRQTWFISVFAVRRRILASSRESCNSSMPSEGLTTAEAAGTFLCYDGNQCRPLVKKGFGMVNQINCLLCLKAYGVAGKSPFGDSSLQ
jgi:hypothetical protein